MPKLIMMCGIPGVGKSTFAKKYLAQYSNYISRDEIRFSLLKEGEDYFSHEHRVWIEYVNRIADCLNEGKDVIADSTNLSEKSRKKLLKDVDLFSNVKYTIECYSFKVPVQIALARNAQREGLAKVPGDALLNMAKNYTFPSYKEDERIEMIFEVDENEKVRLV